MRLLVAIQTELGGLQQGLHAELEYVKQLRSSLAQ